MWLICFIVWLIANSIGERKPMLLDPVNGWTATLILAIARDLAVPLGMQGLDAMAVTGHLIAEVTGPRVDECSDVQLTGTSVKLMKWLSDPSALWTSSCTLPSPVIGPHRFWSMTISPPGTNA
jgi:hypothetical protein